MGSTESAAATAQDEKLEVGHVLFMDVVGYSRLRIEEQKQTIEALQQSVRGTDEFHAASAENRVVRLPTGDGMALVFFVDPEAPLRCAVQISRALKQIRSIPLRMGIHTGLVYRVGDINANLNVAGGGVNVAQRVMDCGDAGHILVSEDSARLFAQVKRWADLFHDIGKTRVKHGLKLHLYSMYVSEVGNPHLPHKLRRERARKLLLIAGATLPVAVVTVFFLSRNLWRPLAGSLPFVIPVQLTRNAAKVPVNAAAISPNGAYLAYLDETGLYILDRQSGVKQAVKLPQEDNFLLASTNWDLAWSQDSSRVYAAGPSSIEQTANLWLFPLLASVPKRILGNVEAESIAADGKIAYIDAKTEEQIWIAGPNGEAPHRIITAPAGNSFAQVAWSPQGTRLSFIKETNDHDVLGTIDTETGETTEVLTGMSLAAGPQRYYSGLCWTKDGRIIFVAANPGGAMSSNLWQVKVDPLTGAKLSEPSPLTQEPATLQSDLSVTSDGNTLAFIRYDETDRVQLGRTAAGSSEFVKLESFAAEEGNNWSNHWTPDSSNLLFASDRRQGVRNVYKQGPNDKSPTPINPSDEIQQGAVAMSGTPLIAYWSWSPTDGDSPSKKWLNVMNLRDGSIHRAEHLPDTEIACALRAKTCILKSTPGNSGPLFSEIDLQTLGVTNLPRPKAQIAKVSDWDISPDASTIAIVDDDYTVGRVWLIHTADGAVSKIDVVGWSGLDLIAWSADGKGIYLGSDTAKQSALLRTDLAGDADVLWKNQTEGLDGEIAPSPNGDYVAFTTTSTAEANVWLLQKF